MLQGPIQSKCEDAGLRSCDKLSEGVLAYVDGDTSKGLERVKAGVADNIDMGEDPQKLKLYVTGVRLLRQVPTVGQYVEPLTPVLDVIEKAADRAIADGRGGRRSASASASRSSGSSEHRSASSSAKATADSAKATASNTKEASRPPAERTTTMLVGSHERAKPCSPLASLSNAWKVNADASCVTGSVGPLVITDVQAPGGCKSDLLLVAGDVEEPLWFLLIPSGHTQSSTGGRLFVPEYEQLTVVARPTTAGAAASTEANCALTWTQLKQ